MRLGGIGKGKCTINAQSELAGLQPVKHVPGAKMQFLPGRGVVDKGGARQEYRAVPGEQQRVYGRYGAAGIAEEHEVPPGPKTIHAFFPGGFPHRVVCDVHAPAVREAIDFGFEILFGVSDSIIRSRVPCQLRFFFR